MGEQREHWGSRLGFIMAAAGSAIGLGTLWKLPYVMGQNGGGAFIVVFFIFNFLIGIPLFMGELLLGRSAQRGAVGIFKKFAGEDSSWNMVGWLSVIASMLILSWYCVIGGWGIHYLLIALTDSFRGFSAERVAMAFELLRGAGSLNILWQSIYIGANLAIVLSGLSKGIEYWSRIMMSALFVMLIVLTLYASTLPGFAEGLHYVFSPNWSKLSGAGILKALGLALFTLSLGYGVMVTYGSYMQWTEDIPKTSIIVGMANFIISLLIAAMIFPMIFTFHFPAQEGEGLLFKALPFVFEQLPGTIVISMLFFSLLLFAALTSSVSMLEVLLANFMDLKHWSRKKAAFVSAALIFVGGLPMALSGSQSIFPHWEEIFGHSFLATIDGLGDWLLAIVSLFTCLFIGWRMSPDLREKGFFSGSDMGYLYKPWLFLIRYVVPISISMVILHRANLV